MFIVSDMIASGIGDTIARARVEAMIKYSHHCRRQTKTSPRPSLIYQGQEQ